MTDNIRDYPSRMGQAASQKFGTLSYLPPLSADEIRAQVAYITAQGWNPAIEHVEPERAAAGYWYMWKLPLFGEEDVDKILAEVEACKAANPGHHVKLIGYDNAKQTQGASLVVYRAEEA